MNNAADITVALGHEAFAVDGVIGQIGATKVEPLDVGNTAVKHTDLISGADTANALEILNDFVAGNWLINDGIINDRIVNHWLVNNRIVNHGIINHGIFNDATGFCASRIIAIGKAIVVLIDTISAYLDDGLGCLGGEFENPARVILNSGGDTGLGAGFIIDISVFVLTTSDYCHVLWTTDN